MNVKDELSDVLRERDVVDPDGVQGAGNRWLWFWGLLFAICLPMVIQYLRGMWTYEHYRYIPFVFLVVGYLAWIRSDHILRPPRGWLGWSIVGLVVLALILSIYLPSVWLAGVAFVVLGMACMAALRGDDDRSLLGASIPLLMLIQMPIGMDQWLINRLQGVTTDLSSVILDVLGVPHSIDGNTVQLVSKELFVAEACSGIQSVFTLAFIACVIIAINRRRLWLTPFYLIISILLALAGNTIRVTTVAVAEHWFASDLSSGWQHDVLGYITLGIATLFLLSFDQLIVTVLHPANVGGDSSLDSPMIRLWNYLVADWRFTSDDNVYGRASDEVSGTNSSRVGMLENVVSNRAGWTTMLAVLAVVGLAAAVRSTQVEVVQAPQQLVGSYILFDPQPSLLQGEYRVSKVGEHQINRNGQEPRLGQNADLWTVQVDNRMLGQVVVSQTYRGWHELCVCYENMDWKQLDREVTNPAIDDEELSSPEPFVTARFKGEDGLFGYLLYTAVNDDGTIPEAPDAWGAFGARFLSRLERYELVQQRDLVMFQFWLTTPEKISPELLRKMQLDFLDMRAKIAQSVVADAVNKTTVASLSGSNDG